MQQKIVLVTGKGGVGKSSVAAGLALKEARKGRRVLLAELGERSYFSELLPSGPMEISYQAKAIESGLELVKWDGESCLKEYLFHYIPIRRVVDLFFENPVMKALVQAAPALKELAILGKATSGKRNVGPAFEYDVVVIDSYATGHFQALVRAPQGMAEAIGFGPMGEQSRSIERWICDPEFCQIVIVALPEELPVVEALELSESVQADLGQKVEFVLNKVWPKTWRAEDIQALGSLQSLEWPQGLSDFREVLAQSLGQQRQYLDQLSTRGRVHSLPWLLEPSSWGLLKSLSQQLEDL